MSEVKTNKISPSVGTTLTLGDAGDTITTAGTATGFGGITTASQWRLTTSFTGDAAPIASNLEEADAAGAGVGPGVLGSSMTESSGIFTFPSTGYWYIVYQHDFYGDTNVFEFETQAWIKVTIDNSTYEGAAHGVSSSGQLGGEKVRGSAVTNFIFDVTDVANCKVRFDALVEIASTTTMGSSVTQQTGMTFIKLADT